MKLPETEKSYIISFKPISKMLTPNSIRELSVTVWIDVILRFGGQRKETFAELSEL